MILLLPIALLILAAYGVYAIISAAFNPWHALYVVAAVGAVFGLLHVAVKWACAAADKWKNAK